MKRFKRSLYKANQVLVQFLVSLPLTVEGWKLIVTMEMIDKNYRLGLLVSIACLIRKEILR